MEDLTEIIICSGYERRLIQDVMTLSGKWVNWTTLGQESVKLDQESMVPLSTGGRLISPEELSRELTKDLHLEPDEVPREFLDEDEYESGGYEEIYGPYVHFETDGLPPREDDEDWNDYFWKWRNARPTKTVTPATREELFNGYENQDHAMEWRDAQATTRAQLFKEVKDLCVETHNEYYIENGLCALLNKCSFPMELGEWMKTLGYCGCFGLPMGFTVIENEKHKILLVEADGESG
jgi:hypothetical protein